MVDMSGRVCMVTGASSGIGKATALGLARMSAHVILVCRDEEKGRDTLAEIAAEAPNATLDLLRADLSTMAEVRRLAQTFKEKHRALHVLVNNAGTVLWKRKVTADNYETQFAVNHLAPFLLTHLLLDELKVGAPSRVIGLSSMVHTSGVIDFDDIHAAKKYSPFRAYRQSKLAIVLFTFELARRLAGTGVTANCLHPGVVRTGIMRDVNPLIRGAANILMSAVNVEEGAKTPLYLATSPEVETVSGKYYEHEAEAPSSAKAHDKDLAERLWNLSEELTGLKTPSAGP